MRWGEWYETATHRRWAMENSRMFSWWTYWNKEKKRMKWSVKKIWVFLFVIPDEIKTEHTETYCWLLLTHKRSQHFDTNAWGDACRSGFQKLAHTFLGSKSRPTSTRMVGWRWRGGNIAVVVCDNPCSGQA